LKRARGAGSAWAGPCARRPWARLSARAGPPRRIAVYPGSFGLGAGPRPPPAGAAVFSFGGSGGEVLLGGRQVFALEGSSPSEFIPVVFLGGNGGNVRVISDGHFSVQLNHFIPGFLSYSVAVF
jgi:hypothetical protein